MVYERFGGGQISHLVGKRTEEKDGTGANVSQGRTFSLYAGLMQLTREKNYLRRDTEPRWTSEIGLGGSAVRLLCRSRRCLASEKNRPSRRGRWV